MKHSYAKGVVCCLIATLSWGAMFPLMTDALTRVDPFLFTLLRYGGAGAAFSCALAFMEGRAGFRLGLERAFLAWGLGTAGFAGFGFLVFHGQQMLGEEGALTASIVMATQPMFGVLINWLVRGVRPPVVSVGFVLVSFLGVALVITEGDLSGALQRPADFQASTWILVGALCWVVYTVGAAFFPHWSALRYTTVTTLLGLTSIAAIYLMLVAGGSVPRPSGSAIVSVLPHLGYTALIAGFAGVLSWNIGNRLLTPLNGVLFMDVIPLTAFAISAASGVLPSNIAILGASVTATALILNNVYLRYGVNRQAAPKPTSVENAESGPGKPRRQEGIAEAIERRPPAPR